MHLQLSMPGYHTDLHGIDRATAHRLITALSHTASATGVRVQLEDETAEERQSGRKGQYSLVRTPCPNSCVPLDSNDPESTRVYYTGDETDGCPSECWSCDHGWSTEGLYEVER